VLTLSFAADASTATIRETVLAPIVVTAPDGAAGVGERILGTPGVGFTDGAIPLSLIRTDRDSADLDDAEGIDPAVAGTTRAITPLTGDLTKLTGKTVALSKETAGLGNYHVGDKISVAFTDKTTDQLELVAILKDAIDMNPGVFVPLDLARQHAPKATPTRWFIQPEDGVEADALIKALDERLTGTGADAVPAAEWEQAQGEGLRQGNQLGLILLLGPAALYSAIAIANTLLMGSLQRRHEFVTSRLLGATPAQIRRMVLWESSLVGAVALSLGTVITVTVGLLIRHAMTVDLSDVPTTVPWLTLLGIGVVCLVLAVGSALAPTSFILRRSHPSAAVE
jgi:putative ABC transport system permease protein